SESFHRHHTVMTTLPMPLALSLLRKLCTSRLRHPERRRRRRISKLQAFRILRSLVALRRLRMSSLCSGGGHHRSRHPLAYRNAVHPEQHRSDEQNVRYVKEVCVLQRLREDSWLSGEEGEGGEQQRQAHAP